MSNSKFCIQQRQKEQQQLKRLLIFGFASSTVLHGILAYVLPRWSFESPQVAKPIEITIIDKPKPKPKPKVESKPIVEPKPTPVKPPPVQAPTPPPPVKQPEPVQTSTPPPPVKQPEPVQTSTPPPKPVPKTPEPTPEILTTPTPAPSQPIVSAPVENTPRPSSLNSSSTAPNSSSVTSTESSSSPDAPGSAVATNSAPPRPEASSEPAEGISCINNCEPEYPSALEGVEGSAGLKLTIDRDGNVIGVQLTTTDSNSQVNRQALLAARQMQFSSPGDSTASVQVKIDFTVEGSEYDRARREEQERREQAKKEQQEAARQEQLEAEQQARQEQLEREQARQQQQQQESTPPPVPEAKPLPTLSPEELDEERLRKFQQRMENY